MAENEVGTVVQEILNAYSTGAWALFSLLILQALIAGLKKLKGVWEPSKPFIKPAVIVFSAIAGILSMVVGGLSWGTALLIFAANGLSPFIHDLIHHFGWLEHEDES